MTFDIPMTGAFLAGLASFLSPCVLPLVPPYLCFLGGTGIEGITGESDNAGGKNGSQRARLVLLATAFVFGFSTVFVAMGATASSIGQFVGEHLRTLSIIAGMAVIVMGLHFLGVLRIGLFYRDTRLHVERRPTGPLGAYLVGLAFGFGWSPCVGPVLTTILMVAAAENTMLKGAGLLAVYAAGIGAPFLLAAAFAGAFLRFAARFRRYLGIMEKAMGAVLVVTGVLFVTGGMPIVGQWLLDAFPVLGRIG